MSAGRHVDLSRVAALFRQRDALAAQLAALDREIATAQQHYMMQARAFGLRTEAFRREAMNSERRVA
jgi:hypothetical protein